ncbi:MAG: metallophosphoesterase [Bacteroidota bacterium]
MNIALITDLHIGQEGEDTFGVDVRKNFIDILAAMKKEPIDYLIVNGDLCFNQGEVAIYQWVKQHLDLLTIPYFFTVGNHDDGKMMAEVFELQNDLQEDCLYFTRSLGDWKGIFLDTSTRHISEQQLQWLAKELQSIIQPIVIFMHHPPIVSGVNFMDANYALDNMLDFQAVLAQDVRHFPIFSGHYHAEKTVGKGNITLQITPSCYVQIAQRPTDFEVDHHRIAYRNIELLKDSWRSTVRYLEGNSIGLCDES